MSGGNLVEGYAPEEVMEVWENIILFSRRYNSLVGKIDEAVLLEALCAKSSLVDLADISHFVGQKATKCVFPSCQSNFNSHSSGLFCNACMSELVEGNGTKRFALLNFMRMTTPELYKKAVANLTPLLLA